MIDDFNECLDNVPTDKGSLIITGREGMFSAGFDLKVISSISHRIYVIKDSRIIETNNTDELISNPQNDYTKKLIESSFIV